MVSVKPLLCVTGCRAHLQSSGRVYSVEFVYKIGVRHRWSLTGTPRWREVFWRAAGSSSLGTTSPWRSTGRLSASTYTGKMGLKGWSKARRRNVQQHYVYAGGGQREMSQRHQIQKRSRDTGRETTPCHGKDLWKGLVGSAVPLQQR